MRVESRCAEAVTLLRRAAVEDVCELETRRGVCAGQAAGDGGTDSAKSEDCDATA
jgi:hypothetical protein